MNDAGNIKRVSVVIPCRNEEKYIGNCLDSIIKQSYGIENIEILIADGMSNDRTIEIVQEYTSGNSKVILLKNEKKVAPAAMNLGISNSTGDIIVIFGAHAYMDREYIKKCVEKLDDENVDCVGGRIVNISENHTAEAISMAMGSPFGVGNALFRYSTAEELVDTVAFGAYKRDIFERIGLFDEELVRNQDDELNFRLIKSGGRILLSPDIVSYYYTRGSIGKLWRQYYQYGFWKVRVIQKHKRPASIRHLVPMMFVSGLVVGGLLSIFFTAVRYLFFAVVSLYLISALFFSIKSSGLKPGLIIKVAAAFIILHISYGIGFAEGIYAFYLNRSHDKLKKNTRMSR